MMEDGSSKSKAEASLTSEEDMLIVFGYGMGSPGRGPSSGNGSEGLHALGQRPWEATIANITITVFAAIIIFCTLAGNTLVITAVIKERRLRKISNSFVINLAVSDILVGSLVTPIALVYQLHGEWTFSKTLCDFWVSVDVICCTASITNLCAISYDRYNAITEPLRYARKRTLKRACLLILVVWLYSVCIAVPPFFGWRSTEDGVNSKECKISQDIGYTFYSTVGAFYLPLLFMIFAYICIYRETSKRTRQWKRGPGSSKMISERDSQQDAHNIRMLQLPGEEQPLAAPPSPQRYNSIDSQGGGTGGSLRRGSGSGVFLRNSSLIVRHSIPYESAIVEVDENTRKEGSSSSGSGSSGHHPTPSVFQTVAIAHSPPSSFSPNTAAAACASTGPSVSNGVESKPPPRRNYGNFPRKLIRQISNLPSSDSSTATSSSSANTTSSSDLPPDHSPLERRFSSALVRQNTLISSGVAAGGGGGGGGAGGTVVERKGSMVRASRADSEQCTIRSRGEGTRKSVTFLTPPSQTVTDATSSDKNTSPSETTTDYTNIGSGALLNRAVVVAGCSPSKNGGGDNNGGGGDHHHHHKRRKRISVNQEKRAAKTLSIVMGCFIVCWLPFFVVALMDPLCRHCHFHPTLVGVVMWLGYCNSALNPIIYTFFNKDFRFAFKKILRCSRKPRPRSAAL